MARILIGIPRGNFYQPFDESLPSFIKAIKEKHKVEVFEVKGKPRDEAREIIVAEFMKRLDGYLLFLDDDHEGHKPEMLDALMKANTLICSLKCFARYYPYQFTISSYDKEYQDGYGYLNINNKTGYSKCKFVGFGMTLIKRDLFQKLEGPYFQCDNKGEREDNYFCDKVNNAGFDLIGCFDHILSHRGINELNISQKRKDGFKRFAVKHNRKKLLNNYLAYVKKRGIKLTEEQEAGLFVNKILCDNTEEENRDIDNLEKLLNRG